MNALTVTVLTLALFGIVRCWDQGSRDYILNIHNEMRKRPHACEMNKLEYDMGLEGQARGWAQGCQFKHEMKPNRGENLAFDTNKFDEHKLIDIATDSWYDEIKMYRYGQNSCDRSCHYTQLVWGTTQKVGCWSHQCGNLRYGAKDAWFLVCFYTPQGNWNGEKPYKTSCPSQCAQGQTNDGGLCVGQAVKECKDATPKCASWAGKGQCQANPAYMMSKCKKSCNAC